MTKLPDLTVRWVPAAERLPVYANKYVVMVDAGGGLCYATTRSYNPTAIQSKGWLNMLHGESVSHWMEGLCTPQEQELYALRLQAERDA